MGQSKGKLNIKNITNGGTWIIAEIGINHEGSVERCLELVNSAALAGADAVKLQTITPELNYAKDTDSYKLFSKATCSLQDTAKVFDIDTGIDRDNHIYRKIHMFLR